MKLLISFLFCAFGLAKAQDYPSVGSSGPSFSSPGNASPSLTLTLGSSNSNYPTSSFGSSSDEYPDANQPFTNYFNWTGYQMSQPNSNNLGMGNWLTTLISGMIPSQMFTTSNQGMSNGNYPIGQMSGNQGNYQGQMGANQGNGRFPIGQTSGNQGMSNNGGSSSNNGRYNGFRNPYAGYGLGNYAFNPSYMQNQGRGNGRGRDRENRGQGRGDGRNNNNNYGSNFGFGSAYYPSYGRNQGSNGMQYGNAMPSYQGSNYMTSGNVPYWYFG